MYFIQIIFLSLPFSIEDFQHFCIYKKSLELLPFYNLALIFYIPQYHTGLPTSIMYVEGNLSKEYVWAEPYAHISSICRLPYKSRLYSSCELGQLGDKIHGFSTVLTLLDHNR
jgi:hypothetical protein